MKNKKLTLYVSIFLSLAFLLCGCNSSKFSLGPSHNNVTPTPTLIVLLTEIANGYPAVHDHSCLLNTYVPITTDKSQGDLMAWTPGNQPELAYVGPLNNTWSWYLGTVNIIDPTTNKQLFTTSNIKVFGDLSWSPDGKSLAFVTLQSVPQDVYSVTILQPDSNQMIDLFPNQGEVSNPNAIQKGIAGWNDNQSLVVNAACGIDCAQSIQFNANGSGKQVVKELRQVDDHSLDLTVNLPNYDVNAFPKMNNPNWSPDKNWIEYNDDDDMTWIVNVADKYQYQIGWMGDLVQEAKWSSDSSMVAFRMDNQINVYKVKCQ